jgi:choline dehydrogenase
MLPMFQRAEADPVGGNLHGSNGMVPVWRMPVSDVSPLDRVFIEAAQESGLPFLVDFNATADQAPGVGVTPKNIQDGHRFNAAFSYIAAARNRSNLTILPDTLVDRVMFDGRKATGIVTVDGREIRAGDVIVSSGAYGSPAILMRSGIGPAAHLSDLGIDVRLDVPAVGFSLMDHPQVARQSGLTSFSIPPGHTPARKAFIQTMVKARSRWAEGDVDLHLYPAETYDERFNGWTLAFGVSLQYARSKGTVRLTSADPEAPLDIDHNYFSHPDDLEAICDGYELMQRIASTPPLSRMLAGPCIDGDHLRDRDALREAVRAEVGTTYHPSSTCRMGPVSNPDTVVDSEGRVHGISGLRVVDASVFPFGPRANLHFAVVAAAERIADRF